MWLRKTLCFFGLVILLCCSAQNIKAQPSGPGPVRFGSVLPATCTPGGSTTSLFFRTTAGPVGELFKCTGTNTWTAAGGGGSVSLTGGTGISVSPNPITGAGVITNTAPGASPAGTTLACQNNAGGGLFGGDTAICLEAITALSTPAAPAVAVVGASTGTSWKYGIVKFGSIGTVVSPLTTGMAGTNNPDSMNYWTVQLPTDATVSCGIYRDTNSDDPNNVGNGILVDEATSAPLQVPCDGSIFADWDTANASVYFTLASWYTSFPDGGFGISISNTTQGQLVNRIATNMVGYGTNTSNNLNFVAGQGASTTTVNGPDQLKLALGAFSLVSGYGGTAVGGAAQAIGYGSTALGNTVHVSGIKSIGIGDGNTVTCNMCEANGAQATATLDHSFVVGGKASDFEPHQISDWFMGSTDTAAQTATLHGADVTGANIAGSQVNIGGGRSTGSGLGGTIHIQGSPAGGGGSGQNALVDIAIFDPATVLTGAGNRPACVTSTGKFYAGQNSGVGAPCP